MAKQTVKRSTTNKKSVISVKDFSISFGNKTVVDNLSFEVYEGETFGFLGSNGSGKTTTMRSLLGIYKPSAGTLEINGREFDPSNGSEIGYLPEERGLYKKESVIDTMTYFGQLKGLTKQESREWSLDYLKKVGLSDKAKSKIDKLSGGQQQKVQLGVTIMSSPNVLVLDEPTKGFDPVNRRLLLDIVEEQRRNGATIIYISHDMTEVERLCDRLLLLKDGKAAAYGTITEVLTKYNKKNMDEVFLHVYGAKAYTGVES